MKAKQDTQTTTNFDDIQGFDLPTDRNARQLLLVLPKTNNGQAGGGSAGNSPMKFDPVRISIVPQRINDGVDFSMSACFGATSPLVSLNSDEQVVYISGNSYCLSRQGARKDECLPRSSFVKYSALRPESNRLDNNNNVGNYEGSIQQVLGIKTSKIKMVLAVEKIDRSYKQLSDYNQQAEAIAEGPFVTHHLNCVDVQDSNISFNCFFEKQASTPMHNGSSLIKCIGSHIISTQRRALVLFRVLDPDRPRFVLHSVDLRSKDYGISRMWQSRNTHALKLVASNFGDFCMVLCKESIYEVEVDSIKINLVQFETKKYLSPGQQFVDAEFLKDTIRLVTVTTHFRVMILDGRILISTCALTMPVKVYPSYKNVSVTTNQEEPVAINYEKLEMPKQIDTSKNQLTVLFTDNKIGLYRLDQKSTFNFQYKYSIPGESDQTSIQVLSHRYMNGDVFMTLRKLSGIEMWRVSWRHRGIQENQQICLSMSSMNYFGDIAQQVVGWELVKAFKLLYVINKDKCLRVWELGLGLVYSKHFFETPTGLAMHPLGFQGVISFKEITRFYYVKDGELQLVHTLKLRGVSGVRYSTNGDQLVMAEGTQLNILNPFTFETVATFSNNSVPQPSVFSTKEDLLMYSNEGAIAVMRYLGNPPTNQDDEFSAGKKIVERKANVGDFTSNEIVYATDNSRKLKVYTYQLFQDLQVVVNLLPNERITTIKILQLFGLVLIGTSEGYILELLWPIRFMQPAVYRYRATVSPIISIMPIETYRQMLVLTSDCLISLLTVTQLVDGTPTAGLYVFSDVKTDRMYQYDFEINNKGRSMQKRTLLSREYLLQKFRPITAKLMEKKETQGEELDSRFSILVGEVEHAKKKNASQVKELLDGYKVRREKEQAEEAEQFKTLSQTSQQREENALKKLKELDIWFAKSKEVEVQKYEQKLLEIVKRSHELVGIKKREEVRLAKVQEELKLYNDQLLEAVKQDKVEKYTVLVEKFHKLIETVQRDRTIMSSIQKEAEQQEKEFLTAMEKQYKQELESETERMEALVSRITKLEKDNINFNKRAKYLENLIDDTEKQINILKVNHTQYRSMSEEIQLELRKNDVVLQDKQEEIKRLERNNEQVNNFKSVHEFLLQEFQAEQEPNERRAAELEKQIKTMNEDLLEEIERRNEYLEQTQELKKIISICKSEREKKNALKSTLRNNLEDMAHGLLKVKSRPTEDWQKGIKQFFEEKFTQNKSLVDRIVKSLAAANVENFELSDDQAKTMRQIENMMRRKHELHTRILRQNKMAGDQERYKEENLRKYQKQNTELVKEYNLLVKQRKTLMEQNQHLLRKAQILLQDPQQPTLPIQRSVSNQVIRKELKPTPFQRYEQQMITARKGNSTERETTSRTRVSGSTSFLKSLIKEVDLSRSKEQVAELVRAKVKSFVNPQLPKLNVPSHSKRPDSKHRISSVVDVFSKISLGESARQARTRSEVIKQLVPIQKPS